jgi:hypothetical protein
MKNYELYLSDRINQLKFIILDEFIDIQIRASCGSALRFRTLTLPMRRQNL